MKHSIICFISLMMTVFCYARTSIYQLPSDSTDWKVYYMQGEEYHRKGKLQNLYRTTKKHSAYMFLIRSYMHWPIVITKGGTTSKVLSYIIHL